MRPAVLQLRLEESSSSLTTVQLFYNTGSGYTQIESAVQSIPGSLSHTFQKLVFNLPEKDVYALRLDPTTAEGTVQLRNIEIYALGYVPVRRIPLSAVKPLYQMQELAEHNGDVDFVTTPQANDPQLTISIREPIYYATAVERGRWLAIVVGEGMLVVFFGLVFVGRRRVSKCFDLAKEINTHLSKTAKGFSSDGFLPLDSLAILFYSGCIVCFVITTLSNFNGSSIGAYSLLTTHASYRGNILLGAPRPVRSDEWNFNTPHILNQALRAERFKADVSEAGPRSASLLDNVPIRHFSTIFRPQFWGFFVFPVEYGYAFLWQAKGLLLLTGLFTFFLFLTRSSFWAVAGSVWFYFSPCTQWTYSWPSGLPEMVGLFCFALVFSCYLTVGKSAVRLSLATVATAVCAIDFAMCAYVPHMLPLVWLGLFFFSAWCFAERKRIFCLEKAKPRVIAFAVAVTIVAAVGLGVYLNMRDGLAAIAATDYPGKRLFSPGTYPFAFFLSHFFSWMESEGRYPQPLGNICEASGFLWLAPFTLFCIPLGRLNLSNWQKYALPALWAAILLPVAWLTLPFSWPGTFFLLNRTGGSRCVAALGLANISIVVLYMARFERTAKKKLPWTADYLFWSAVAIWLACAGMRSANHDFSQFLSPKELLLCMGFVALLLLLMLGERKVEFALAIVGAHFLSFSLVNPIQRGLDPVTKSELYAFLRNHRELLQKKWIVFSPNILDSGFITATGAEVYTGLRYIPDVDHFKLFEAHTQNWRLINNDFFLNAVPSYSGDINGFQRLGPVVVNWNINPSDSTIPALGVGYAAFVQRPPDQVLSKLKPLSDHEMSGYWLYQYK